VLIFLSILKLTVLFREHTTVSDFKAKLRKRGKSLQSWALANGYHPRTVSIVVQRWGDRTDRKPHGGISRKIMADLRHELEE
jgi:gp16 family phage-associated protein